MITELTAVCISLASIHMPYEGQNQFNYGIHAEGGNYRAGVYRNSNNGNGMSGVTSYVGYSVPIVDAKNFRVGLNVALAYGYKSPVVGNLEFRVGQHFVVVAAPPIRTATAYSPTTIGFLVRFPTKE
jgi:hypothetical protein